MIDGPAEMLARYRNTLGKNFGEYFYYLNQATFELVGVWDVYRSFFGTNEQRVNLLNRASGYVTCVIQDTLHERVILGICQLTDPENSRGLRNLTVTGLPSFIDETIYREEIAVMCKSARDSTSFARDLRNKLIAHSDFAAKSGSQQIEYSSRLKIVKAITAIIKPLRHIHMKSFDSFQFYHAIHASPDENMFLKCIHLGVEQMEIEKSDLNILNYSKRQFPDWLEVRNQDEFDSGFISNINS